MIFLPSRMYLLQQLSDALACHQVVCLGGERVLQSSGHRSHHISRGPRPGASRPRTLGVGEAAATMLEYYNHFQIMIILKLILNLG